MGRDKFISPLWVQVGKRKIILNLNQYRNTHFRILNNAKIAYKNYMGDQIRKIKGKYKGKCCVIYTVYKGDRRDFDIGNICSIHQKFFEDAMVELGRLEDDTFEFIPLVIFCHGGIDKDNPRVEIEVLSEGKGFLRLLTSTIGSIMGRVF